MGKKQKSKSRLDKYYYLAKDHGFRSRAVFKLIQLNKKYNFFANATVCIDLCAAPGGWLQAASKFMPLSSIKVGVDLDPIKPIPGCSTIVSDITSQECRVKLEKEIKHMKADIVLNDGAPNVGSNWQKDAYSQSELVLYALKLATEFLKPGGWFVTKVFRSSDYPSLLYVMQQLFKKVEATKPLASRQVSAEIFVVCQGFKSLDIDPKFLDPKYALKQVEDEEDMKMNSIKSIKALLEATSNRHRSGYYDNLFKTKEFFEFIETPNPFQLFYETNKIVYKSEKSMEYLNIVKKRPADWEQILADLKVLGKIELQSLLNWREKIRAKVMKKKKVDPVKKEENEDEYKKRKMDELEEEIKKIEKSKKKKFDEAEKKREKNELRQKISFIKENSQFEADGTEFDQGLFDYLKRNNINIEEIKYKSIDEINKEIDEKIGKDSEVVEEIELSDFSEEDYYHMMNENIEQNLKDFKEHRDDAAQKRHEQKMNSKGKKKKRLDDDLSDIEENNKIVNENDKMKSKSKSESSSISDDDEYDDESDYEGDYDEESEDEVKVKESKVKESKVKEETFINPLSKLKSIKQEQKSTQIKKETKEEQEEKEEKNEKGDSDEEDNNKYLNKKRKKDNDDEKDIEYIERNDKSSEYDSDDIAEIRAISRKMLRKKDRLKILHSSYNRYAFDDMENAPDWFIDDEKLHNKPSKPVTKEEIQVEREYLKQINDRMPKKVLEAKNRKKKRLARQMEKIKKKAQVISNQEEIGEGSKIRQIDKLYKRELSKNKEEKKYIVIRGKQKTGRNSRSVKYVDKRLKKDKRGVKRAERKNKDLYKRKNIKKQQTLNKKKGGKGGKGKK